MSIAERDAHAIREYFEAKQRTQPKQGTDGFAIMNKFFQNEPEHDSLGILFYEMIISDKTATDTNNDD
jgi:hypothetical protein